MRYGSVCSGIEAASVAWHPLGWTPVWFAEVAPFPAAVLAHHYPDVPNRGDFTRINDAKAIDLLVGGTPCQSFSVAGGRAGLDDPRGNLALEFLRLAARTRPRWLVFENVPGLLSSGRGRDFGIFLGALGKLGYGWAYRVLDAQHFGVPQRRRRIFVVGHLGDWRRAAAVLFELSCLSGNPPPSRETREGVAGTLGAGPSGGGWGGDLDRTGAFVAHAITTREGGRMDPVASPVSDNEGRTYSHGGNNAGRLHNIVFDLAQVTSKHNRSSATPGGSTPVINAASQLRLAHRGRVRRLTPRECERLQGFPDDWTLIPGASDVKRYRAIGNSMAVPVMRWIGERIQQVDAT